MIVHHSMPCFDETDGLFLKPFLMDVSSRKRARELGLRCSRILGKRWGIATQSDTDALTGAFANGLGGR